MANIVNDGLFCEFCYVFNLENNTLEIYKGFNQELLGENKFGPNKYAPMRYFKTIPFAEVNKNIFDKLKDQNEPPSD
jgi:hypothetical protein